MMICAPRQGLGARHDYEVNRARIADLWAQAQPVEQGEPAALFLERSGVPLPRSCMEWSAGLRMHPALEYWHMRPDGQAVCLGQFPALLTRLDIDVYSHGLHAAPEPHAVALQRTYLAADGALAAVPVPIKLTGKAGRTLGAAARLSAGAAGDALGIAVGVVPALRIAHVARMPVWAVPDSAALVHVCWPRSARSLHVFADADVPAQWEAAAELARKARACGLHVVEMFARLSVVSGPGYINHCTHLSAKRQ